MTDLVYQSLLKFFFVAEAKAEAESQLMRSANYLKLNNCSTFSLPTFFIFISNILET